VTDPSVNCRQSFFVDAFGQFLSQEGLCQTQSGDQAGVLIPAGICSAQTVVCFPQVVGNLGEVRHDNRLLYGLGSETPLGSASRRDELRSTQLINVTSRALH
jgi:hypothetical protein